MTSDNARAKLQEWLEAAQAAAQPLTLQEIASPTEDEAGNPYAGLVVVAEGRAIIISAEETKQ